MGHLKNRYSIFTALLLIVFLILRLTAADKKQTVSFTRAKVTRVIDGDTIVIDNGQKVRYIGMDAPEVNHLQKLSSCFGPEAKAKNKRLTEGKRVLLERDISEKDRYGRLLRYVRLAVEGQSPQESLLINEYLVRTGYGRAAFFPPDLRYGYQLFQAQEEAKRKRRGLWGRCEK